MSDIKVIKGLKPWDILERASNGEPWAYYYDSKWVEAREYSLVRVCEYMSMRKDVAIIDTSTPEIDWYKFDWDFFNQYGGLKVEGDSGQWYEKVERHTENFHPSVNPSESPMYYWAGGEQPVPSNVEVEVVFRDKAAVMMKADNFDWCQGDLADSGHIIAFKLTGRVL